MVHFLADKEFLANYENDNFSKEKFVNDYKNYNFFKKNFKKYFFTSL